MRTPSFNSTVELIVIELSAELEMRQPEGILELVARAVAKKRKKQEFW
jgi:hypothetical protein